jgi:hypothetical protein
MRCNRIVIPAVFMLFGTASAVLGATSALTLDYPGGGQVFVVGTTQQVRLGAKTKVTPVSVDLSTDGGVTFTNLGSIAVSKTGIPALSFTVPNTPSGNCIIRVSGSIKGKSSTASSAPFAIFAASSTSATPAAGSVTSASIVAGAIVTQALADGSVTNPKLAPQAVSFDKVTSGSASNNFVLTADGAGNAAWQTLTTASIPDAAITAPKLAPNAVDLTSNVVTGVLPISKGGTNSGAALNNNRIMVSSGGKIVEAAALTNGQLLIGSTGAAPSAATLTGTANRVTVANGSGTITLSGPQDLAATSSPTFNVLTLTGLVDSTIKPAADATTAVQLQTAGGASVVNVDTTNLRVGIGTTAPGANLDLKGSATQAVPVLRVTDNNGNVTFAAEARAANAGTVNTFAGVNAGIANTSGDNNTFVGEEAGFSNSQGTRNTFVGQRAGLFTTTTSDNSFFGHNAGLSNTGFSNTLIGQNAGQAMGSGFQNTCVGQGAGIGTSGVLNTFIGASAGMTNTTEAKNTLLGSKTDITAGITNATAIGADAVVTTSSTVVLGNACSTVLTGGLKVPTGAAGIAGTATLVAGTVTISTTAVTASSVILVSYKTLGGTTGTLSIGTVTAGSSFVISSSSATDTSVVSWWIVN